MNVGLTGGIACGKSTVADMFIKRGAHIIDFDNLAHEVQKPGRAAWEKVAQYFGEDILLPDKNIDRNKLAKIVFENNEKLNALNQIVHPYVFLEWHDYLEKIVSKEKNAIILAAVPLLFEIKRQHLFDLTVLVIASPEEQLKRLMVRNSLSREEAQKRIKSQMPIEEKKALADIIIDNQKSLSETEAKVEEVWKKLMILEQNKRKQTISCGGKNDS
ncbi:MAG: dephospho-CoA kinase [Deltaproteobacteria bacterium RBG_19FT_COMBO_43_11]|nr:MAG: dephospho-CoA kinase [Deltaproteobacteria bacterium RBG_19FT_COMBO_43_11]